MTQRSPDGGHLPWLMAMRWSHLAFLHWPVPVDVLRPHVPAALDVDTFDGEAWVGVVPFHMSGVRLRGTPAPPGPGAFHELNVRTYVTHRGVPGVWFLSLDAASRTAVEAGRTAMHLRYLHARIALDEQDGGIRYAARRVDRRGAPATFRARYAPAGPGTVSTPGSLEHFLTERYALYASELAPRPQRRLWRADVTHEPWTIAPADHEVAGSTLLDPYGIDVRGRPPLAHVATVPVDVRARWRRRVA